MTFSPEELLSRAVDAATHAYCPYSHFRVGAALLTAAGEIVTGCNVESASYGLTICAERTAFCTAIAEGYREFHAIAIAAGNESGDGDMPYPCGACRQVMVEFCKPDFRIIVAQLNKPKALEELTLGALLPNAFKGNLA